ncbi:MAG: hypothetical protein JXR96_01015 [Deltaproteobacteria bacterium]|nr:hypothetical protein [Deltaproteobacteria bacterium]
MVRRLLCLAACLLLLQASAAMPCSMFAAHDEQNVLAGNNEDYYGNDPTIIWFVPAEDGRYGYAAWGYQSNHFSQGGMNDQGLFWDGFATPEHTIENDTGQEPFTLTTLEEVMQTSATVDEAIANLRQYHLGDVLGNAQLMFVDRHGDSAIFEGDAVIAPSSPVYQVCTNFIHSDPELGGYPCWRYEKLVEMMESDLQLTPAYFTAMAEAVHQGTAVGPGIYTRYTNIADLIHGQIYLFYDLDFGHYVHIDLAEELALGAHEFSMTDLERSETIGYPDGTACSHYSECRSGHCADGVCCDSICNGVCQSCSLAGHEGSCLDVADGTSCADPDPCNGDETCESGRCQPSAPLECDDGIACTADACVRLEGCVFEPVDADCDDSNPCTLDICDAEIGCSQESLPDDSPCGECGLCRSGSCEQDRDCGAGCSSAAPAGHGSGGSHWPPVLAAIALLWMRWKRH